MVTGRTDERGCGEVLDDLCSERGATPLAMASPSIDLVTSALAVTLHGFDASGRGAGSGGA